MSAPAHLDASLCTRSLTHWHVVHCSQAGRRQADLRQADLRQADLRQADFRQADFRQANLGRANLADANLSDADFSGTDLSVVYLYNTLFLNTDLTAVRGLETCHHGGPSTFDHRTLARSGPLPLAFLRGCGLSDWEIEATQLYQPTLADPELTDVLYRIHHLRSTMPLQYYSCFISYSSVDEAFCRRLHDRMQEAGLRTWFAPEDMRWGRKLHEQLDHAIQHFDKLLLVLTETSVHSPWVEFELRTALAREQREQRRVLFPLRLVDFATIQAWQCFDADTGKDLAREIRAYYIPGDFSHWQDPAAFEAVFARLLRDLQAEGKQPED